MFTGIIETKGIVTRTERVAGGMRLEVYAPDFGRDMAIGDSVAVDGACLTIVKFIRGAFLVDVSDETLERSTLGGLKQGSHVNLERALRLSDRLGGHIVSGHIDAVGRLAGKQAAGNSTIYRFTVPPEVYDYLVEKGSVSIDGISLTVARLMPDGFTAAVVPHTEEVTTLKDKPIGAEVNAEADMFAKYVRRYVEGYLGVDAQAKPSRRSLGDLLKDLTEGS
ncbi:MAG TPA: riboflavin synthase [Coriobacteriia bacterium]